MTEHPVCVSRVDIYRWGRERDALFLLPLFGLAIVTGIVEKWERERVDCKVLCALALMTFSLQLEKESRNLGD